MAEFIRPRPTFPKKAVITSGMPYGNKLLHYGHVGMTLRADIFARFLRDRIGFDNVIFVSGTDCYGSPAVESYRKLKETTGYNKSIEEYVESNHIKQAEIFKKYEIGFNGFYASALGRASEIHKDVCDEFLVKLLDANMVSKRSSLQFYDRKFNTLLNGRQVVGKCPIEGCMSEHGYADECGLGHQYLPQDLIDPVSALSGETPELVKIENLYFDLEKCIPILSDWITSIERQKDTPSFMVKEIKEFFKKPEVYIKRSYAEQLNNLKNKLPPFNDISVSEKAPSITIQFETLQDRETACDVLAKNDIRYRTGKTLTPFRLSGDISWGVPCREVDGLKNQTFYVWPESLFAPISFSKTYLESIGKDKDEWKKYWCSKDGKVYQFLGEDNLYFYGPAQQAMFLYYNGTNPTIDTKENELQITKINPIKSILYLNQKASSSGSVKPPMAEEFLNYYTAEQFRMHFLAMNLSNNNVSLMPKAFNPTSTEEIDPMVREGNLLTNVYNRILRTVFYTTQNNFNGIIPQAEITEETMKLCEKAILDVEMFMHDKKLHQVFNALDVFIRNINKIWVKEVNGADEEKLKSLIVNTLQMIFVANTLLHPIVPSGTENVADYIGFDKAKCFSWNNIFSNFYNVLDKNKNSMLKTLKEKEDFFVRHAWQLEQMLKNDK
ncbi:MAG: class I tRNA ligase family protein [Clostridia bacterium]|nr:class I tRNA ligase family protein [Clostridia bacterium]